MRARRKLIASLSPPGEKGLFILSAYGGNEVTNYFPLPMRATRSPISSLSPPGRGMG